MGTRYASAPEHSGYMVGTDGSVWSQLSRKPGVGENILQATWKQLKLYTDPRGYKFARLTRSKPVNGKRNSRCRLVSRLVLLAFAGPCPTGKEACHKNGNPSDNRRVNLYWGSHADNMADAKRHGTDNTGSRNGQAKLDEKDVRRIRAKVARGQTQTAVSKEYGITPSAVCNIVRRRNWAHVK